MAAAAIAALVGCDRAPPPPPVASATAAEAPRIEVDAEVAAFYKARGFRSLWVTTAGPRPEAKELLATLARADRDGLDPQSYRVADLKSALEEARSREPAALARAELLLSSAFARYVADLRRPRANLSIVYVDAELKPQAPSAAETLQAAAAAVSLKEHLRSALSVNPLYRGLRNGLEGRSAAEARLIRANMERARTIQPAPGARYIIVDAAGAQLWLMEGGKIRDRMRAIVGKNGQETPAMAGFIQFAVLNPYWNMPHDLARERAKRVLRQGPGVIARERLQILSDWSPSARPIKPSQVNWRAVASGQHKLRMRQLPGGDNVMGKMKFMMPNHLGIYLHDTPNKASFAAADRRLSSGCVRVEDAERLARWLFNGSAPRPQGAAPEQRVDLPEPVPVYITYMTALPAAGGGIVFQADAYGRDAPLLAALSPKQRRA